MTDELLERGIPVCPSSSRLFSPVLLHLHPLTRRRSFLVRCSARRPKCRFAVGAACLLDLVDVNNHESSKDCVSLFVQ